MWMRRQAGALILYGGWLLLFNPDAHRPDAPLAGWKKKGEYDSGFLCQQARRKSVDNLVRDQQKSKDGTGLTPWEAEFRYRCELTQRFEALKR